MQQTARAKMQATPHMFVSGRILHRCADCGLSIVGHNPHWPSTPLNPFNPKGPMDARFYAVRRANVNF